MAASYVSVSAAGGTLGADPSVPRPTGADINGRLLVAMGVISSGGSTMTPPAGWTAHPNSAGGQVPLWTRITSSEPSSYTFIVSGAASSTVTIACFDGIDASLGVEVASFAQGTSPLTLPSINSPGAERLLFQMVVRLAISSWTPPGTATERYDANVSGYTGAGGDEIVGAGATGTRTWTPASSGTTVGYIMAIAPKNVDGSASSAVTISRTATGVQGAATTGTLSTTATLSSSGNMGRQGDGARAASVTLTASGATNITGTASLGLTATRAADGAGVGVAEGIETVQLTGSGSTNVHSGADASVVANRSAAGAIGTYGSAPLTATVAFSASGVAGGIGNLSTTATLTATGSPGANAQRDVAVTLTASANVDRSSDATLSVSATVAGAGSRGFTGGATLDVVASFDGSLLKRRYFTPPTQLQAMPDWFWGRFDMPVGISVLKQNGHYVNVPTPTNDELVAAGAEGTDWFRGGYTYEITAEVEAALQADGYL